MTRVDWIMRDDILECRSNGMVYREIAKEFGVSIATVGNVVKYNSNSRAHDVDAVKRGFRDYKHYRQSWEMLKRKWSEREFWENLGNDIY